MHVDVSNSASWGASSNFLLVMFSLKKENPTLGDAVDEIFGFINKSSKKVSNFFGAENS